MSGGEKEWGGRGSEVNPKENLLILLSEHWLGEGERGGVEKGHALLKAKSLRGG